MTILVFELFGRNTSASRALREVGNDSDDAGRRLSRLGRDVDGATRSFNPLEVALTGVHRALVQNAAATAKAVAAIGGLGGAALTVTPYLAQAAQWLWAVGEAALGASPALLAQAAGLGVVFGALKLGFSGFGDALKEANTPAQLKKVNEALANLHPEARKTAEVIRAMRPPFDELKKSIQGEIFKGLAGDVKAAGEALLKSMGPGMVRVGMATNTVIKDLLSWGKSTEGIKATANLTNATATAMDRLAPQISRVVTSFANMIGRISEVSMAAGASGLGGALDWLAGRMDRVNAASVTSSLAALSTAYHQVKDAVTRTWEAIQTATRFYQEHRAAISAASDALSILAIAFGGPVIAAAAAVGMIIRHWDDLKAAYTNLTNFFTTQPGILSAMEFLRAGMAVIMPSIIGAFVTIRDAVMPPLTEIWNKIQNELVPAFGAFFNAIAPVVSIIVDVLGPVVAAVFGGILQTISGVISIITGILNVFAGLLTGNWSRLWEGIKQIFSGAWDAIIGLLNVFIFGRIIGLLGRIPGLFGNFFINAGRMAVEAMQGMGGRLWQVLADLVARLPGALGNVGVLLLHAGKAIVQGLINGIVSMIGAAGNAIRSVVSTIRNMLPFSPAKEGPLSGSGSPDIAGRKLSSMVATGMLAGLPDVVAAAYRMAGAAGLALPNLPALGTSGGLVGAAGQRAAQVALTLDSAGSDLDRVLIEVIRKAIRQRGGDAQVVLGR